MTVLIFCLGAFFGAWRALPSDTAFRDWLRNPLHRPSMHSLREEIADVIAHDQTGAAPDKAARDRILGTLDLAERNVEEVMRHRSRIAMINIDTPPEDIIASVLASPYSRLPIFRGSDENILGVIHSKDLLREVYRLRISGEDPASVDILKVAKKPYFIPETTALDEQIRAFLKRRTPFALVVDEYGELRGLITLEDILEEIVGDITDEFDVVARGSALKIDESGTLELDGAMTIRDLNRAMDWHLPDANANTIAGLMIHEAQIIPSEGQTFIFHGLRFEVLTRRDNRITRLRLRPS